MNEEMYVHTFADCIPVKGYIRSVIYDLGRQDFSFIPNGLYDFLSKINGLQIHTIKELFKDEIPVIDYLNFLFDKEYIFLLSENKIESFPKLQIYWDYPAKISNATIEISEPCIFDFNLLVSKLDELGCENLSILSRDKIEISAFSSINKAFEGSRVQQIDYSYCYCPNFDYNELSLSIQNFPRIRSLSLHSAPEYLEVLKLDSKCIVHGFPDTFDQFLQFKPDFDYFSVNIHLFMESHFNNTFFNRKLFIGKSGEVITHIGSESILGTIHNLDSNLITSSQFQVFWKIKKSQIDICKCCEFRYMCVDSRIPVERKKGDYYHETECNYNPFIAKWRGEPEFRTIQESGVESSLMNFSIDIPKLNQIIAELYG